MKIVITSILLILLLVGCENTTVINEYPEGGNRFNGIVADKINIITDSKTGCKYIFVDSGIGYNRTTAMSPLIKSDGNVDCGK